MPAIITIQPRRGTAAQWVSANPTLAMSELGYETDTKRWKRGDGATAWNSLAYSDTAARIFDSTTAGRALLTAIDAAAQRSALALNNVDNTADTDKPVSTSQLSALNAKQDLDPDLTAIAALSPSNDDVLQRKSGAWTNRTPTQLKTDLGLSNVSNVANPIPVTGTPTTGQVPTATSGTTATWQTPSVGGGSGIPASIVDAKGDLIVGTAVDTVVRQAVGVNGTFYKANSAQATGTEWVTVTKSDVGLSAVDNTADTAKPVSTLQAAANAATLATATGRSIAFAVAFGG